MFPTTVRELLSLFWYAMTHREDRRVSWKCPLCGSEVRS